MMTCEQVEDNSKFTDIRLPTTIKPIHYDLKLKPDLEKFTFEGSVMIDYLLSDSQPTINSIVVHANELVIFEGAILNESSKPRSLKKVTYSKDSETATLEFDDNVPSRGVISLEFTGILNNRMMGFYRTSSKIDGAEVYGATTQFATTYARTCFPCWDEPAVKATFTVTIQYIKTLSIEGTNYERVALSNMPEVSRVDHADGMTEVKFDKSPIMSTYLLAFVVGPFEAIEGTDGRRPIRVFTTLGNKEQGRFGLDVACKALPYYEDYFGIEYPLPKMDLIAVSDFSFGAMENWGLIIYREARLLVDPNNTSANTRRKVALVVAHEIAHQWFGNLVTMEWWTHLWLNEGFASFMEYLCVDYMFPEYQIWSQFVADSYERALNLDALHNSHPIEVPVSHSAEINQIFDAISYNKGASVIRMLYNFIGNDAFCKGMKSYLTKFAYNNASTEDLWDALEVASSKPVRKIMSGWTAQKGFPWLSVSRHLEGGKARLTLEQSRFTADGKLPTEEASVEWIVPINVITEKDPSKVVNAGLLEGRKTEITLDEVGDHWIKLNPGTIDLYRSAYPEELTKKLFSAISDHTISPMDRLGLLADYFALCQAGKVSTVDLLKLLGAFKSETNFTVWTSIDDCMAKLNIIFTYTNYRDKFHAFGRNLYADIFKRLTWIPKSGETDFETMTRAIVINRLVAFNDRAVIDEAKRRFSEHMEGKSTIPADFRGAIYRAMTSDDNLYEIFRTAELNEEKNRALAAIGFVKGETKLNRAMAFALSNEVRNQDRICIIASLSFNDPSATWKMFQDEKEFFQEVYGTTHLMQAMVQTVTKNFATEDRANEIAKFFNENKFPGTERIVQQVVETIRSNANWLARDNAIIDAFLSNY